ncbi:MAG: glycosyltransferase [Burkholderiales bacterium]|nr:glycosyltransferase [Burkholderiales bacterium]
MTPPEISIVIPVYDEEAVLPALFERLYRALDALGRAYEIVFVDDGSRDRSPLLLREQHARRRDVTRVVLLNRNYGQHMAIMAGFEQARGSKVVTLDADLQNPPEQIGVLLAAMDAGHDYVGSVRRGRQDRFLRRNASRLVNALRERTTRIRMNDHGSMMRAYASHIVRSMTRSRETTAFIPALAYTYAVNPVEVEIAHAARAAGRSKYSWLTLARLNFDLMTGFSIVPLRLFSLGGCLVALASALLFIYHLARGLMHGPQVDPVFGLFTVVFFLIGVVLFGLGLLGEYVGRIYLQVRDHPRFVVAAMLDTAPAADPERR